MYTDWLNFQSECKKARAEAERQAAIKKRKKMEMLVQFIQITCILLATLPILIFGIIYLLR